MLVKEKKVQLGEIFNCVDLLKQDFKTTTAVLSFGNQSLTLDVCGDTITWQVNQLQKTLTRNEAVILNDVNDFHCQFFLESSSILYRINCPDNQIRGYFFFDQMKGAN